jgi:S1-C subfamily serine protease
MARWVLHLGVLLMVLQSPTFATIQPDWVTVIQTAAKQVVRLEILREGESTPGTCSAVVVNKDEGYLLTAQHCIDRKATEGISVTANGRHAEVLKTNAILDLAMLRTKLKYETTILMADDTPPPGTPIAVVGYAYGDPDVMFQFGYVSQTKNSETKLVLLNADIIAGDSGGAAIDTQGRLVAINSRLYPWFSSGLAGSVPIEQIKEFAEEYLPGAKK